MNAPWNEAIPVTRISIKEDHVLRDFPLLFSPHKAIFEKVVDRGAEDFAFYNCSIFGGDKVNLSNIPFLFIIGDLYLGNDAILGIVYATGNITLGDNASAVGLFAGGDIICGDFALICGRRLPRMHGGSDLLYCGTVFAEGNIIMGHYAEIVADVIGKNNTFDDFAKIHGSVVASEGNNFADWTTILGYVEAKKDNNFGTRSTIHGDVYSEECNKFDDYVISRMVTARRSNFFGNHAKAKVVIAKEENNYFKDFATIASYVEAKKGGNFFGKSAQVIYITTGGQHTTIGENAKIDLIYGNGDVSIGSHSIIKQILVSGQLQTSGDVVIGKFTTSSNK